MKVRVTRKCESRAEHLGCVGMVRNAFHLLSEPLFQPLWVGGRHRCYCCHFTGEETEALPLG